MSVNMNLLNRPVARANPKAQVVTTYDTQTINIILRLRIYEARYKNVHRCGTVVPQQVHLLIRWEVGRHTVARITALSGVNVEDNLPPRSQDGHE